MFHVLSWVHVIKQQFIKISFIELIHGTSQTDRDQKSNFYFYNDKITFKNFESNLLKIDENITKALIFTRFDTSQLKKIGDSKNICNVNPL